MESSTRTGGEGSPAWCGQYVFFLGGEPKPHPIDGDRRLQDVDVFSGHKALCQESEAYAVAIGDDIEHDDGVTW